MGGKTKRERKFLASGGVKKRLAKGTITKKGKLKKRKKSENENSKRDKQDGTTTASSDKQVRQEHAEKAAKKSRPNDFMDQANLGELDIDSFFAKFADNIEAEQEAAEFGERPLKGSKADDSNRDQKRSDSDDSSSNSENKLDKSRRTSKEEKSESSESDDDRSASNNSEDSEVAKKMSMASRNVKDSKRFKKEIENETDDDDESLEDLEAAEARMRAEMAKIEKSDPEFHEFLKENESSLLQFGEEDADVSEEDEKDTTDDREDEEDNQVDQLDPEDGSEAGGSGKKMKPTKDEDTLLTLKLLKSLARGTFLSHSIKSLKRLLSAFKAACHMADPTAEGGMKTRPGESGALYVIGSSKVFDQLMVMCFTRLHHAFKYHIFEAEEKKEDGEDDDTGENAPINPKKLENSKKWKEISPALLSFFRSTLHLLSGAKEPQLLVFILKSLSKYVPYLTPFTRAAESILKSLTEFWSAPLDTSEDYQIVRLNAFLRIRQLALTQPFPFIEECLKKTYLAYAKRAKFGSSASMATALPTLTFMGNCLVDLYSLDYHSSYQHSFVYIRQLALLLRSAMQKKTSDAVQQVYCWQYIHCLNLWVAVLAESSTTEDGALMRSLIYPLTEIILGTARLVPNSTRVLPIKFHCVRLLQQLAAAGEVFIPTTSLLLDCLDLKEWYLKPKKSRSGNARVMQMQYILKMPKDDALRTHDQIEAASAEFFQLMEREIELYRYSAGFPEFSFRITARLKQFAKEIRRTSPRQSTLARGCIDTCERYSAAAVQARSKLEEPPKAISRLECLRPVSEPTMRERHEHSIQRERKELEASRPLPHVADKKAKETEQDELEERTSGKSKAKREEKQRDKGKNSKEKRQSDDSDESDEPDVMAVDDEVQEGIDWSDEDEGSDDDDDDDDDEDDEEDD